MKTIIPIPNVFNGILSTFFAILMVRVTYPIIDPILQMWESGIMKAAGLLVMWMIYFFVLYFLTWQVFFQKEAEAGGATTR